MCGPLLMQPTQLPHKMIVGMRYICVLWAVKKSTPPYIVENVQKIIVPNVLAHIIVGDKTAYEHNKYHICCAVFIGRFGVVCPAGMVLGLIWWEGSQVSGVLWSYSGRG